MSLVGSTFLVLITVLTVLALLALVLLWPRLAPQRPLPLLGRLASLLLVNALVLITAGTALNHQYNFYSSWSDLLGDTHPKVVGSQRAGGDITKELGGPVSALADPSLHQPPAPPSASSVDDKGRILHYLVPSASLAAPGRVTVILPEDYSTNTTHAYPVIEAFSGYPNGGDDQWIKNLPLYPELDRLSTSGGMSRAIIVIPDYEQPAGRDTECVNGNPSDPQTEDWLARDVPNWVSANFRVQTSRSSWATIGLSEGGWCASMLTMLHPERYAAAISFGGYFQPLFSSWKPFPTSSPAYHRYDLVNLAIKNPPPVALWILTSKKDSLSYPYTQAMLSSAHAPLAMRSVVLSSGGHRFSVWKPQLDPALLWLATNIPAFAPEHPH